MAKIAIISRGPVGPDFNGGAMLVWGLVNALKKYKDIEIELILYFQDLKKHSDIDTTIKYLDRLNINPTILKIEEKDNAFVFFKNFFRFNYSYFYQTYKIKNQILKKLKVNNYDLIITYHFDSLTLINNQFKNKTIAMLGDQPHEPRIFRRNILKKNKVKRYILDSIDNFYYKLVEYQLLKNINLVFYFAFYYSLKKTFYKNSYLNTPLDDKFKNEDIKSFLKLKYSQKNNDKNDIYLLGGLHGTVTISGLIFLNQYLKTSKKNLKFNFNIIGQGSLIKELKNLKNFSNVSFIERIDDLNEVFKNKKFLLVPNTIVLGTRVRIITALMYGLIVITHKSNLSGTPELETEKNCLVFENQYEFEEILERIRDNKINLLQISLNARNTFEKYYENSIVIEKFMDLVKKQFNLFI